ncbi:MAG: DUF4041 domain-containing protein [Planctomycetota bacterium]|nr:DUF4041 domain-containing protein [Planctomycetota bacterium]
MNILMLILLACVAILAFAAIYYFRELEQERSAHERLKKTYAKDTARFKDILDVEAEVNATQLRLKELEQLKVKTESEYEQTCTSYQMEAGSILVGIKALKKELRELDELANLQEFGFYPKHYEFSTVDQFKDRISKVQERMKGLIKDKAAAVCHTTWHIDGNVKKGQKMINEAIKVALRAFNGECDAAIAKVKYNNILVMEKRIRKSCEAINKLNKSNQVEITKTYLNLKLEELHLAHEYEELKQAIKEEQRELKEQMREEQKALKELEKIQKQAEKEEESFEKALAKAKSEMEHAIGKKHLKLEHKIEELQRKLLEAQENSKKALSQAQLTKSGHVYIISNIGSFGENVFKIGMTRRLEPLDRVKELSSASVPFNFDVHAMIYSKNAPDLERQLHELFDDRRVNRVNRRREYFYLTAEEIVTAVEAHHGKIMFTKLAEAEEYRKSIAIRNETKRPESSEAAEDEAPLPPAIAKLMAGRQLSAQ